MYTLTLEDGTTSSGSLTSTDCFTGQPVLAPPISFIVPTFIASSGSLSLPAISDELIDGISFVELTSGSYLDGGACFAFATNISFQ